MSPEDAQAVAQTAAKAANMAAQAHEAAMHSAPKAPAEPRKLGPLRGPDGKISANRLIASAGALAGSVTLIGGLVLAFIESLLRTGTTNGKDIALAGLGTFFSAGLTKVGGSFSERGQAQ